MRIGKRGRVTIPREIREQLGLSAGDEVTIIVENGEALIVRGEAPITRDHRATEARVRKGKGTLGTEELNALVPR